MPSHQPPLAYLITISCYGKRLHGEPTETVDRTHKTYGSDYVPTSPFAAQLEEAAMRSRAFEMTSTQRTLILEVVQQVCGFRSWRLWCAHVRTNHLHVVVGGPATPEKMMNDFKVYGTRALRRSSGSSASGKHWARHGSTRYLWDLDDVIVAIDYVVNQQGQAMALWENPDKSLD